MSVPSMDNKGAGPLRVPGFGDIPLEEELPISQRFVHGIKDWEQVPAITLRELTMVAIMNELTDRRNWHMDIFNQDVVDLWRDEILGSTPLMSEKAWEWCVAELRDKGAYLKDHGYFRVLDTGSCVCKSDTLSLKGFVANSSQDLSQCLHSMKDTYRTALSHISTPHCIHWSGGGVLSWPKSHVKVML
jgi:hypothetical protein